MFEKLFKNRQNSAAAPAGMRIYAIGDIHGCLAELDALMAQIHEDMASLDQQTAQIIFLGDYVDRGPDSKGVIDRLLEIKGAHSDVVFLKGNHEAGMLNFLSSPEDMTSWLDWGGRETLKSYGAPYDPKTPHAEAATALIEAMPPAHLDFFQSLSLYHEAEDYVFVHAGLRPGRALTEQKEEDLLWIRKRFHNAAPHERPEHTVVHGHQPGSKPINTDWRICVDTGAYYSGNLTAVVLEDNTRKFLTASA